MTKCMTREIINVTLKTMVVIRTEIDAQSGWWQMRQTTAYPNPCRLIWGELIEQELP